MNPAEAEKIINAFGKCISEIGEGEIVQDVFSLPCSPGKIRYAYFVYVEELIQQGLLDEKTKNELEQTYALIDTRFVESAAEINKAWPNYAKDKNAREIIDKYGGLISLMPSPQKMIEFHNFVADCQGRWIKKKK